LDVCSEVVVVEDYVLAVRVRLVDGAAIYKMIVIITE